MDNDLEVRIEVSNKGQNLYRNYILDLDVTNNEKLGELLRDMIATLRDKKEI